MYVCMYIMLTPRRVASFFLKGSLLLHTPYFSGTALLTGSGSILGCPFLLDLQFYVGFEPPVARQESLVLAGIRSRTA